MDYAALLYDPIYDTFGVAAVLTASRPEAAAVDVTVIERTTSADASEELELDTPARAHSSGGASWTRPGSRQRSSTAARSSSAGGAG